MHTQNVNEPSLMNYFLCKKFRFVKLILLFFLLEIKQTPEERQKDCLTNHILLFSSAACTTGLTICIQCTNLLNEQLGLVDWFSVCILTTVFLLKSSISESETCSQNTFVYWRIDKFHLFFLIIIYFIRISTRIKNIWNMNQRLRFWKEYNFVCWKFANAMPICVFN